MKTLSTIPVVLTLGMTAVGLAAAAPAEEPVLHHVRYTVTTDAPYHVKIYYRDSEPAVFSDYSHNPFIFSPKAETSVGPDQPWVFDAHLANPDMWAMVVVQSAESPNLPAPGFNCELAVNGVVVKQHSGPKGALCSIRNW